jgi:Ca2+-binding EF-hand superfamily protein
MLKEGLSPSVAFKAADLNHNNVITVDELREAIKKLLPDDLLSLSDLKNIMLALDTNKNGVLEEGEFI